MQFPAVQTDGHALPLCQAPFESHVCGTRLLHCLVPGVHTPWQAPPTHAWFEHVTGALQVPLELHVCTPLFEHCVVPGTQTPVHAPFTQADATHAVVEPHCPFEPQT